MAEQPAAKKRISWERIALAALVVVNVVVVAFLLTTHQARTNPDFCGLCHTIQPYVDSYLSSAHLDNIHYQADVGCKDCHTDDNYPHQLGMVAQYFFGESEAPLARRKFDQSMCTRCHISMEYHADRTDFLIYNPHLSHWPDLVCSDCHLTHDTQIDYCSGCHDNGGQRMTGGPVIPRADNPWQGVEFR